MIRALSIIFILLASVISFVSCRPTSLIDDLGTLGGDTFGFGINDTGNVTGASYLTTNDPHEGGMHAFRYVDGLGMIDLGALPTGNISAGNGISNSGLVAGGSFVQGGDWIPNAFLATAAGNLISLGTIDYFSNAWDVNDKGQVTGNAMNRLLANHAFLWTQADGMQDIGTLGGTDSTGYSINESGQIAGESQTGNNNAKHAFRFTEGVGMVDLGTLGGKSSSAYGINESGQVVGESDVALVNTENFIFPGYPFLGTHAFLWTEGVGMIDLGQLGGGNSNAYAINNHEVVVGYSTLEGGTRHAFRWTKEGGMIDLNTLLPNGSGWVLYEAYDINDMGQITGYGAHNGKVRAFRLNPFLTGKPTGPYSMK